MLEHRSHSKRELTEKIARTTASRAAAQAAADHLEEIGLLDDRAYAESFVKELLLRKGYGVRRVRQELARKGIAPEIADQVLDQWEDLDQTARENMARVLEKRYPRWREEEAVRRRAVAALQRLGYTWDQVRAALGAPLFVFFVRGAAPGPPLLCAGLGCPSVGEDFFGTIEKTGIVKTNCRAVP